MSSSSTFAAQVEALRSFFGLDASKTLAAQVDEMNRLMNITAPAEYEALPLPAQVERLLAATGVTIASTSSPAAAVPSTANAAAPAPAPAPAPVKAWDANMGVPPKNDVRRKYLERHNMRMATLKPPADERADKIRAYQKKLASHRYTEVTEGDATAMPSGGFSTTLSMETPPEGVGVFANMSTFIAAKGPPSKRFLPVTHEFKVA